MISSRSIDQIRLAADIVEVVGDFVSLKRRGTNYIGLCPFHNEKSPSFNVTSSRGIFKCFGCGKGGDSITFMMEHEKMSYMEALRYLAKKYHIEIEESASTNAENQLSQQTKESLYIVLNFAKEHFKNLLHQHSEGQNIGLTYFKERGFLPRTIEKFELGYALNDWDNLLKTALSKGYKQEFLEKAGLVVTKDDGKIYDRFRGRVVFPIHNATGRVVGFGARALKSDEKPKYINSPESEVYHKSDNLYGIYQAKEAIRRLDNCFLVEGYTDVVSMYEAGIENAVASSGTSLTEGQIKLIKRFSQNVTVLFDGDAAGIKASLRGIDLLLEQDMNIHACVLPDGEDPDSFAKKYGSEKFTKFVAENAKDFITFKTEIILKDAGNDPFKRANAITEIVESIVKIPDSIKRSTFYRLCSQHFNIDEQILVSEGNKLLLKKSKFIKPEIQKQQNLKPLPKQQNYPLNDEFNHLPHDFSVDFPMGEQPYFGDEPPFIGFEDVHGLPISDEMPFTHSPTQEVTQESLNLISLQEEELTRLLVCYGGEILSENLTVGEYLLHEVEEISFEHPIYSQIVVWYKSLFESGIATTAHNLANHENMEVRNQILGMQANRYELSKNWQKMFAIEILEEQDLLDDILFVNILRLKHRLINKVINDNHQAILYAQNEDEVMELLKKHQLLKASEMQIADLLGSVVSGKL